MNLIFLLSVVFLEAPQIVQIGASVISGYPVRSAEAGRYRTIYGVGRPIKVPDPLPANPLIVLVTADSCRPGVSFRAANGHAAPNWSRYRGFDARQTSSKEKSR